MKGNVNPTGSPGFSNPFIYAYPLYQRVLPLLGQTHFFHSIGKTTVFVYLFSNYTNGPNPPSKHSEVYFSIVELETNKEHCFICHSYTRQGGVSMGCITPYSSLDQLSSVGAHTAFILHPSEL